MPRPLIPPALLDEWIAKPGFSNQPDPVLREIFLSGCWLGWQLEKAGAPEPLARRIIMAAGQRMANCVILRSLDE